jgi:hypothetical protein
MEDAVRSTTLDAIHVAHVAAPSLLRAPDMPRVKYVRDYSRGSIAAQLARCITREEVAQFVHEVNQALADGRLKASSGTVRKWTKQAGARMRAINRATLLDARGNPIL